MAPLVLSRDEVRQVDRRAIDEYGMSGLVLMENAGRGATDVLERLGLAGPVVVCCGKGNNAGDGFVIARHLDLRGHAVSVLLWSDPAELAGDAAANFRILEKAGARIERAGDLGAAELDRRLAGAAWLVDALLGTGARGAPRPPFDAAIDRLNAAGPPLFAIDLPSGLDCDTGAAAPHAIRAAHTCTFVALKPGFLVPGAKEHTGAVHVVDIGVPRRLLEEFRRAADAGRRV